MKKFSAIFAASAFIGTTGLEIWSLKFGIYLRFGDCYLEFKKGLEIRSLGSSFGAQSNIIIFMNTGSMFSVRNYLSFYIRKTSRPIMLDEVEVVDTVSPRFRPGGYYYTREDIEQTAAVTFGQLLQTLVPQAHIRESGGNLYIQLQRPSSVLPILKICTARREPSVQSSFKPSTGPVAIRSFRRR